MPRIKKSDREYQFELTPQRKALTKLNISLKCKNENQKKLARLIENNEIVIVSGPAGTGKTYVACACALQLLAKGIIGKIIIAKSVTVLEGEDIGYLKGNMKEKMEPIMVSFMDNFHKIIGKPLTQELEQLELIEVTPLAFIRGRSIDNSFIIIDEAQNISMKNMRSAMTRIGDCSKLVIMGDTKQIDLNKRDTSSLSRIVKMFNDEEGFGVVEFSREDIVRNPIIIRIEEIFDAEEAKS